MPLFSSSPSLGFDAPNRPCKKTSLRKIITGGAASLRGFSDHRHPLSIPEASSLKTYVVETGLKTDSKPHKKLVLPTCLGRYTNRENQVIKLDTPRPQDETISVDARYDEGAPPIVSSLLTINSLWLEYPCPNLSSFLAINRSCIRAYRIEVFRPVSILSPVLTFNNSTASEHPNLLDNPLKQNISSCRMPNNAVESVMLLWDVKHAQDGLLEFHNTCKEFGHATPFPSITTSSSPLFVPPPPLGHHPLSLLASSMLRNPARAHRPRLVDPNNFLLSFIEEEDDIRLLLDECATPDCEIKENDVRTDTLLDQLEAVALEVRELPLPEPNLTRWRRHLGLTVGTGDSEVGGHEASHSGRHGTAKDDLVFNSPVRLMPVLVDD